MQWERPVWAEIKLENVLHNYQEVRRLTQPRTKVMGVVKANAYGHGIIEVAKALCAAGIDYLGVALINEAIQLRESGINKPILVLGWTPPNDFYRALKYDITLTIFSCMEAKRLSDLAVENNKIGRVHIKIDTGMGRIGIQPDLACGKVRDIIKLPGIHAEGIFTHFAKADEVDTRYTLMQLRTFNKFISQLERQYKYVFPIKHAANSAAIISYPETYFNMVRAGIMLYGLKPSCSMNLSNVELRQAMTLKAKVSHVKKVLSGYPIGYGGNFITKEPSIIATLPLGYADGYSRMLSGKSYVLTNGKRAPVVGNICMDQLMFDATNVNSEIKKGDTVTLIGREGDESIGVDDLAGIIGTISYETLCMISQRVPRIYI